MTELIINGAFRGQAVTGQQRYAHEISSEILRQYPGQAREVAPSPWWQKKAARAWLWAQSLAVWGRKATLISLTSRSPILAYRHVLAVHDIFVLTHPEWYSRKYVMTHAPILRLQLRTASAIIAVSEPVAEQIVQLTGSRIPVIVAPNAPAQVFREPVDSRDAAAILQRHSLTAGHFILSVASKDPRKNLRTLVRAYLNLPPELRKLYPLVLVGGSSSVFAGVNLPVDPGVRHLGYVSDEDLAALYASSSLVAFPSLDEGFGLPAIEALSAGARLLVSDVEVMRWVCQSFASYVDPKSEHKLTYALKTMLDSSDCDESRRARQEYAHSQFTWRSSAEALISKLDGLFDLGISSTRQGKDENV
ncbi:glycosyltransferase family 4 protein [Pseudarthrobacter equi]|uniref:glycosyltransferase family 4 protein n=1 Tax=Pseudarthrobacter equi TaxID=728066 RepID=UPI0021C23599|nr:glycosyltransferase family 1 protein [Pseudarthrobacter equi]MCT9625601.1 glycosyltransferase family 4 protein [Pseudarthrobacter equi]